MTATASRIGLACAGGVVEGAFYEVGALCALDDAVPGLDLNHLHVYVGVSSGAIVTTFLAAGLPMKTLIEAVTAEHPDRSSAGLSLSPSTLFRPDWDEFARRIAGAPATVIRALRSWITDRSGSTNALVEISSLVPVGVFDHAPIEQFVASVLADLGVPNRFSGFGPELRIVAVDVDTARTAVFGAGALQDVPVSRAVQASTALPVLYAPVEIDGRSYIDGVATRTLHASQALDAGADLVLCVNPIVPVDLESVEPDEGGASGTRHLAQAGLPLVLSQTFRTLVHSRLETGFRRYAHSHPGRDVLLIEPHIEERSLFFSNIFSFSNRREVCERAYSGTLAWLAESADAVDAVLSRHGLALDRDVVHRPARVLGRRSPARTSHALDDALDRLEHVLGGVDPA